MHVFRRYSKEIFVSEKSAKEVAISVNKWYNMVAMTNTAENGGIITMQRRIP